MNRIEEIKQRWNMWSMNGVIDPRHLQCKTDIEHLLSEMAEKEKLLEIATQTVVDITEVVKRARQRAEQAEAKVAELETVLVTAREALEKIKILSTLDINYVQTKRLIEIADITKQALEEIGKDSLCHNPWYARGDGTVHTHQRKVCTYKKHDSLLL